VTDHEDNPPNTPPPGANVLPSIPPPARMPGDFAPTEGAPTDRAPERGGMTLSQEDLRAIRAVVVDAVKDEFDSRTPILADAMRVIDVKINDMHRVLTAEDRDTYAETSRTRALAEKIDDRLAAVSDGLEEIRKLWDVSFQQGALVRRSLAPRAVEELGEAAHELSEAATGYLQELRAETGPPTPRDAEEDRKSTDRR
jgi:hypothetical protein